MSSGYTDALDTVERVKGINEDEREDLALDVESLLDSLVDIIDELNFNCEHSYIDAQGVGGGYVFKYCNKCGKTKSI